MTLDVGDRQVDTIAASSGSAKTELHRRSSVKRDPTLARRPSSSNLRSIRLAARQGDPASGWPKVQVRQERLQVLGKAWRPRVGCIYSVLILSGAFEPGAEAELGPSVDLPGIPGPHQTPSRSKARERRHVLTATADVVEVSRAVSRREVLGRPPVNGLLGHPRRGRQRPRFRM